jgi:hypothetical protein
VKLVEAGEQVGLKKNRGLKKMEDVEEREGGRVEL